MPTCPHCHRNVSRKGHPFDDESLANHIAQCSKAPHSVEEAIGCILGTPGTELAQEIGGDMSDAAFWGLVDELEDY